MKNFYFLFKTSLIGSMRYKYVGRISLCLFFLFGFTLLSNAKLSLKFDSRYMIEDDQGIAQTLTKYMAISIQNIQNELTTDSKRAQLIELYSSKSNSICPNFPWKDLFNLNKQDLESYVTNNLEEAQHATRFIAEIEKEVVNQPEVTNSEELYKLLMKTFKPSDKSGALILEERDIQTIKSVAPNFDVSMLNSKLSSSMLLPFVSSYSEEASLLAELLINRISSAK